MSDRVRSNSESYEPIPCPDTGYIINQQEKLEGFVDSEQVHLSDDQQDLRELRESIDRG